MFGEVLKKARKKAGKTLKDVAEYCGLTIGNISDIEHGRRRPPNEDILLNLEQYLGVAKNSFITAARKNWKVPHAAISIFMKRPDATMALLRATEDMSESDLKQLVEEFKKKRDYPDD